MKKVQKLLLNGSALALVLVGQYGCTGSMESETATQSAPVQQEVLAPITSGTVVETMNAGGYTYVLLENAGQSNWVAIPTMDVKPGQKIELQPGAEMGPFKSVSLNRTFEKITFSSGPKTVAVAAGATLPTGHPAIPSAPVTTPPGHPVINAASAAPAAMAAASPAPQAVIFSGKLVETMDVAGYTYLCLEKDGVQSWAAIPVTAVKVGDDIEIHQGMVMKNFNSKALNRTFDAIIFSDGIVSK